MSHPFAPQAQLLEYHAAALAEQRERLCVLLSPPPGRREALGPEERHSRVNRLLAHSHARLSEIAAETERVRRYTAEQERELTALLQQQQQQQQQQAMQQQQQQQRQQPFACGPALHDVGADGSNGHYGGAGGGDGAYWEGNTLVIEIPNIQQAASFLIGKKGVVIEALQDTHNCKIQIEKEPLGEAPLRKVFVTSHISRDNCERCAEGIAKKMVEFTELQGQKSVPPNFRAAQAAAGGFCGGFNSGGMGGGINADMNMMANQGFGIPGIGNSGGTPSRLGAPSQIESDSLVVGMGNGGGTMGHMSYAPGGMGGGFACGMGGGACCCDSSMGVGGGMTKLHTDMLEMMQGMQSGGGMSGGGMQGGGCGFGAGVEPSTMQQQQQQHMQHHVQMQMQGDMQMARRS